MSKAFYSPKMLPIQQSIQWSGIVRLHQLNEDNESKLSSVQAGDKTYYACASTGLLFDQQSGRCTMSSAVELKLDTVKPDKCTFGQFNKWVANRQAAGQKHLQLKRGPKPKGQRSVVEQDFDDAGSEDVDFAALV